ncbi:MAG TPA: hypothetical protein VNI20_13825, partial [Fimbriimonadaceae bacterium]|nr:hypothetical protein [Fimbriimonadaceae bacterium]
MGDRTLRANAAGPVLSGVGASLLVTGLMLSAVFLLWPRTVSAAVSAQAVALPVAPVALFLVGVAVVLLSLWKGSAAPMWVARILLLAVVASAVLAFLKTGITALDEIGRAWSLVGRAADNVPIGGLSQFGLWLGVASASILCATFVSRWLSILAQAVGVLACVCLAALVASAGLGFEGASDPALTTFVPSVSLGLCAYLAAFAGVILSIGQGLMSRIEPGSSSALSLTAGLGFLPFVPVFGAAIVYARDSYLPELSLPREAILGVVGATAFVLWALFNARLTAAEEARRSAAKREASDARRNNDVVQADLIRAEGDLALAEAKALALEKRLDALKHKLETVESDLEVEKGARVNDQEAAHARAKEAAEAHTDHISQTIAKFDSERRELRERIEALEGDLTTARNELSLVSDQHEREQALYESRLSEAMDEYDALLSRRAQERERAEAQIGDAKQMLIETLRSVDAPLAFLEADGVLVFVTERFS